MGSLSCSIMPVSLPPPLRHHRFNFALQTHLCRPVLCPRIFLPTTNPITLRCETIVFASNSNDPNESSSFIDKDGVVDDMDGYLNSLSLEYDSVWDTKPSWCQPWTITLTGLSAITGSWLLFHSVVITTVIFSFICAWWYIFLYSYPKAYADMISERRKKVVNGIEDTFGLKKGQTDLS